MNPWSVIEYPDSEPNEHPVFVGVLTNKDLDAFMNFSEPPTIDRIDPRKEFDAMELPYVLYTLAWAAQLKGLSALNTIEHFGYEEMSDEYAKVANAIQSIIYHY